MLRSAIGRYPEVPFVFFFVAAVVLLASYSNITFQKFGILLVPIVVFCAIWVRYAKRGVPRLSDLAYYPMMLLIVGMCGMVLSYLVVDPKLPLYDRMLVNMDSALFFNWPDWLKFYRAHPWYQHVLQIAYDSSGVQIYGSAFFFALSGKRSRNRELLRLAIISSMLTIIVFHSFPALGPFFYFAVGPSLESLLHMPHLLASEHLTLSPLDLQGLISFPSFHTVMAVTFMYVHRGQRWLTRGVVLLNLTMLLATITCGAHYLIDLIGGMVVTALSIVLVRMTVTVREDRLTTPQPASPA
jgi:membrane-associated phospholipid phosphatase